MTMTMTTTTPVVFHSRRRRLLRFIGNSTILLSSSFLSSAAVDAFQIRSPLSSVSVSGSTITTTRRQHSFGIGGTTANSTREHGIWRTTKRRVAVVTATSNASHDENDDVRFRSSADGYMDGDDIDSLARRRLLLLSLLASSTSTIFPERAGAISTSSSIPSTTSSTNTVRIIKPPLDERSYTTYILPTNNLRILLCSDPTTTSAATSMSVHVGACSDPVEIPGLAHFCEHMLFLGTELYPGEDSFSKFLSSNGETTGVYDDVCAFS
jgi:hypothetical protein